MTHTSLPENYAVIQSHNGWFAAEVYRAFGPPYPEEGYLFILPFSRDDKPLSTRRQAIEQCQEKSARQTAINERYYACRLHDEQYPERNAWYRDLIETVTGNIPLTFTFDGQTILSIFLPSCSCGKSSAGIKIVQSSVDEALACAAEHAYSVILHRQQCTGVHAHESA